DIFIFINIKEQRCVVICRPAFVTSGRCSHIPLSIHPLSLSPTPSPLSFIYPLSLSPTPSPLSFIYPLSLSPTPSPLSFIYPLSLSPTPSLLSFPLIISLLDQYITSLPLFPLSSALHSALS